MIFQIIAINTYNAYLPTNGSYRTRNSNNVSANTTQDRMSLKTHLWEMYDILNSLLKFIRPSSSISFRVCLRGKLLTRLGLEVSPLY